MAAKLPQPHAFEALIVACWKASPVDFCLDGYPEYPCTNRVAATLYARNGPLKTGLLTKDASGIRITPAGRLFVEKMKKEQPRQILRKTGTTRESVGLPPAALRKESGKSRGKFSEMPAVLPMQGESQGHLEETNGLPTELVVAWVDDGFRRFDSGKKEDLGWGDAYAFWQADDRHPILGQIAHFDRLLIDREDPRLRRLGAYHDYLTGKFDGKIKSEKRLRE
jgi:hypothetical protein